MNTGETIGLSLAIGLPLIFVGVLFYHGETTGKPTVAPTGMSIVPTGNIYMVEKQDIKEDTIIKLENTNK